MARMIDGDAVLSRYYDEYEQQDICDGAEDRDWLMKCLDEAPTLIQPNEWVSVEERLPEDSECWRTYIVTVNRSHWPTSSYDICDAPYDEQLVSSAQYDSKQKIWHLPWGGQINALIQADDAPLNGDFVTHWMLLPAPPDRRPPEGEEEEKHVIEITENL